MSGSTARVQINVSKMLYVFYGKNSHILMRCRNRSRRIHVTSPPSYRELQMEVASSTCGKKETNNASAVCIIVSHVHNSAQNSRSHWCRLCMEMQEKIPMYGDNAFTFLHGRESEMLQTSVTACHGDWGGGKLSLWDRQNFHFSKSATAKLILMTMIGTLISSPSELLPISIF